MFILQYFRHVEGKSSQGEHAGGMQYGSKCITDFLGSISTSVVCAHRVNQQFIIVSCLLVLYMITSLVDNDAFTGKACASGRSEDGVARKTATQGC